MKILSHVDLGKAFESLKKSLIEIEKQTKQDMPTALDTGIKYANAYVRLSAAVEWHIAMNTGILPFVRFNPDNKYKFYQDFRWREGVPHNVNFYPTSEQKDSIVFVGDRHGVMDKHKKKGISGEYGNGSIFIYKEYIPHLLEWCRAILSFEYPCQGQVR